MVPQTGSMAEAQSETTDDAAIRRLAASLQGREGRGYSTRVRAEGTAYKVFVTDDGEARAGYAVVRTFERSDRFKISAIRSGADAAYGREGEVALTVTAR